MKQVPSLRSFQTTFKLLSYERLKNHLSPVVSTPLFKNNDRTDPSSLASSLVYIGESLYTPFYGSQDPRLKWLKELKSFW